MRAICSHWAAKAGVVALVSEMRESGVQEPVARKERESAGAVFGVQRDVGAGALQQRGSREPERARPDHGNGAAGR